MIFSQVLSHGIAEDQIRDVKRMKAPTVTPQPGPPINQPPVVISDALAKFIGTDGTFPQEDALKYLWDYIKANQLEVFFIPELLFAE
jgi:upstream activation factor subunit UAF30